MNGASATQGGNDGLYERDTLAWSEQQAALLRRLAAGERVNAEVDWENLIEEVEDVGRSELHTVESLVELAIAHLVKLHVRPESEAGNHWRAEVMTFLNNARRRYAPSMRQRIDLDDLYRLGVRSALLEIGEPDWRAPEPCPFRLATLLEADIDSLARDLAAADGAR